MRRDGSGGGDTTLHRAGIMADAYATLWCGRLEGVGAGLEIEELVVGFGAEEFYAVGGLGGGVGFCYGCTGL